MARIAQRLADRRRFDELRSSVSDGENLDCQYFITDLLFVRVAYSELRQFW